MEGRVCSWGIPKVTSPPVAQGLKAILGELEDVEDKLLHLDPIGLLRLDQLPRFNIHVWDLLLSNMVLQLRLVGAARGQESKPKAGTGTPRHGSSHLEDQVQHMELSPYLTTSFRKEVVK